MTSNDLSSPPPFNDRAQPQSAPTFSTPTTSPNEPPYSIYSKHEKWLILSLVSTAASFSGFASNIYFPALPRIATDLSVPVELVNLTVTSYMIFQGLTPTFWGALADYSGRRTIFISTFVIFFAACVCLANTQNYAMLVVFRCLQSTGSAATIAIGSGTIGDIATRPERGGCMGVFQAGLLVPLALGPVIGGALASSLGWRSIFWFLAIYGGVFLLILIVLLPETLRALVGNGSVPVAGLRKYPLFLFQQRHQQRFPCTISQSAPDLPPIKPINLSGSFRALFDKSVTFIMIFLSIYYTIWQMSVTVLSALFKSTYGLNDTQVGLTYIANGIGAITGTLLTGRLLDIDYRRIKQQCDATGKEVPLYRARLRTVWIWSAMQIASVLVFGWTLDKRVHISVPIISSLFVSWGAMSVQSMVSTYIVDVFPEGSASASAALNLARCLLGAGGTAAALPILNAVGVGWGFTVLAAIMVAALGLVVLQMASRKRLQVEKQGEEKDPVRQGGA